MVSSKSTNGVISNDPLRECAIGDEIWFKLVQFGKSNAIERPNFINNWEFFNGTMTALALKRETSCSLAGNAVIVAPGLAISATHLFSDALEDLKIGRVVPYCFGIRPNGMEIWRVGKVNIVDDDDIALLSLEAASPLPDDRTYYRLGITTRAPKNGEELHIVGFRSEGECVFVAKEHEFRANLYSSRGAVTAVYPYGRDRRLVPYPAIELNCGSLCGMSGGAAFDRNGLLVGIIARGFDTETGDGPTYVSWIIKSLARQVDLTWPPGLYKEAPLSLLSMDKNLAFIDRREVVEVTSENRTRYKVWFE